MMKLLALLLSAAAGCAVGAPAEAPAPARVEARSADLLAVGIVHGDTMGIHVSRLTDNAPVRDAAITVILRGTAHAATAETDGGYSLQTKDLTLPGAAAVEFQVTQGAARSSLKGTLDIADSGGRSEDKNNARQLWWWVLNFAVCFGVLWLISRRRKAAQTS
ncbi:MAG TPA: hypothetical protein VK794_10390 [Steroidobacteraceae bacterium]|nr:hypothetical protein [Steroidobacteraceae bacterium]